MSILLILGIGVLSGLLARAMMPGRESMNLAMTGLLGVAGAVVGAFLGSLLTYRSFYEIHTAGILGGFAGALALLATCGFVTRREALP